MAAREALALGRRQPTGQHFPVAHPSRRGDHHRRSREAGPPAQAEVVAQPVDRLVEAPDGGEQAGVDQRERPRDLADRAEPVVLALVQLTRLDHRDRNAGLVDQAAELPQPAGIVPADELGADDPGSGGLRRVDQGLRRAAGRRDVVVAEEQVVDTSRDGRPVEDLIGGRAEAGVPVEPVHDRIGHRSRDALADAGAGAAAGVDHQDPQSGVVLGRQRGQRDGEPVARVVDDQHRQDRGWCRRSGFPVHDARRVVALPLSAADPRPGVRG